MEIRQPSPSLLLRGAPACCGPHLPRSPILWTALRLHAINQPASVLDLIWAFARSRRAYFRSGEPPVGCAHQLRMGTDPR